MSKTKGTVKRNLLGMEEVDQKKTDPWIFYSEMNALQLPLFSGSKTRSPRKTKDEDSQSSVTVEGVRKTILLRKTKTVLNVHYLKGECTLKDKEIYLIIQAIFLRDNPDLKPLKKQFETLFASEQEAMKKALGKSGDSGELSDAKLQVAYYTAMEKVSTLQQLYIPVKEIADILNEGKRANTQVTRGIERMINTYILPETTLYAKKRSNDAPILQNPIPLLKAKYSNEDEKSVVSVFLSPLALASLLNKEWTDFDLNLLKSFDNLIAFNTYTYLKSRLFMAQHYRHTHVFEDYEDIIAYSHLSSKTKPAERMTQLRPVFDELIKKGFIIQWALTNGGKKIVLILDEKFFILWWTRETERNKALILGQLPDYQKEIEMEMKLIRQLPLDDAQFKAFCVLKHSAKARNTIWLDV